MDRATLPQQGTRNHPPEFRPAFAFERTGRDKVTSSGQSTRMFATYPLELETISVNGAS